MLVVITFFLSFSFCKSSKVKIRSDNGRKNKSGQPFLEVIEHRAGTFSCPSLYKPLISRVRGPYGKFWTKFFPSFYGPSAKRAGHENEEGKNEDP